MPSLIEAVTSSLSGPALEQITQSIGADPQTTSAAIQAALPMLISALAQMQANREGRKPWLVPWSATMTAASSTT